MVLNPNFFLPGTKLSLKVQLKVEEKVGQAGLKSFFTFFDKFDREHIKEMLSKTLSEMKAKLFFLKSSLLLSTYTYE